MCDRLPLGYQRAAASVAIALVVAYHSRRARPDISENRSLRMMTTPHILHRARPPGPSAEARQRVPSYATATDRIVRRLVTDV